MKTDLVKDKLINELNYKPNQVEDVIKKLGEMDLEIKNAFNTWVETGELNESLQVQSLSVELLISKYNLKIPAAFLMLDWLKKDPDMALDTLHRGLKRAI